MKQLVQRASRKLQARSHTYRNVASAIDRFRYEKHDILFGKSDKSSKGTWDAPIIDLLERLNAEEEYCTLSSCSGRAYLWRWHPEDADAEEMFWPSKSRRVQAYSRTWRFHVCHRFMDVDLRSFRNISDVGRLHSDIEAASLEREAAFEDGPLEERGFSDLDPVRAQHVVWLKYEPLVCHVACDGWASAARLIQLSRIAFPRSSLLSWKKRFVVQVIGEDHLDMPVAEVLDDGEVAWFGGSRLREFLQDTVLEQKFAKNSSRTDHWRRSLLEGMSLS